MARLRRVRPPRLAWQPRSRRPMYASVSMMIPESLRPRSIFTRRVPSKARAVRSVERWKKERDRRTDAARRILNGRIFPNAFAGRGITAKILADRPGVSNRFRGRRHQRSIINWTAGFGQSTEFRDGFRWCLLPSHLSLPSLPFPVSREGSGGSTIVLCAQRKAGEAGRVGSYWAEKKNRKRACFRLEIAKKDFGEKGSGHRDELKTGVAFVGQSQTFHQGVFWPVAKQFAGQRQIGAHP
jgi:hypothetical protein